MRITKKSQKAKFSYEEIYNEIAEKFVTLNMEMPIKPLTQLRKCLDNFNAVTQILIIF